MRERHNAVAERLWDVVKECVESGVTVREFLSEVRDCWAQAHRDLAKDADDDFKRAFGK